MRPTGRHRTMFLATAAIVGALAACGGASSGATIGPGAPTAAAGLPTGGPVTDPSKLCDLLGPGDFAAAGLTGAGAPTVNSDGPGSAYCVYAGQSGATGGIEFDAFIDEAAEDTFDVILTESPPDPSTVTVPGADEAVGWDGTAGNPDEYSAVVVRKGDLVFSISAPAGAGMAAKLGALAGLVIARASGLAS